MRSSSDGRTVILDAGTVRAFDAAAVNLDVDVEAFTLGHIFIEVSARAGDATLDVTLAQGATLAAAFRSTAYTPQDGAFVQFASNTTQERRCQLKSQTVRITLTFGGTNGSVTTRVWASLKLGNAL